MAADTLTRIVFWDVGQGDCSVLHFTDDSIIIIDTGDKNSPLVEWLSWHPVSPLKIEAMVFTHTHADHIGAAQSIVEDYGVQIGQFSCCLIVRKAIPCFAVFFEMLSCGKSEPVKRCNGQSQGQLFGNRPIKERC
jgi:glyoxylase-like metal-dependent hydrolase (beta-lactamase superfamily II)